MTWKQPGGTGRAITPVCHRSIWHIDGAIKVAIGVAGNVDSRLFDAGLGIIDEKIFHQVAN